MNDNLVNFSPFLVRKDKLCVSIIEYCYMLFVITFTKMPNDNRCAVTTVCVVLGDCDAKCELLCFR